MPSPHSPARASWASHLVALRAWYRRWRTPPADLAPDVHRSEPPPHALHGYVSLTTDVVAGRVVWTMSPAASAPPSLTWLGDAMTSPDVTLPDLPLPPVRNGEAAATEGVHLLFLHGGAYAAGVRHHVWELGRAIVEATGATFWVPDYPLAPASTAAEVTSWTAELYAQMVRHIDPSRVLVLGESSGGGLALSSMMVARDAGVPLPARIITWAPWLDVTLTHPDISRIADPVLDAPQLRRLGLRYAGELPPTDPRVSPLYGTLDGLPPVEVHIGTLDLLLPDAHRFAQRPGVDLTLYPASLHGWGYSRRLPEAARLRQALFARCAEVSCAPVT